MTTFRVARRSRYAVIDRATANDDTLSFRARGVLLWLLDKPDDWRCDSEVIARAGTEGREAVRTALRELEGAGYLRREKVRSEKGRWVTVTTVYERPEVTGDGFPGVGRPGAGVPGAGSPGARTEPQDRNPETEEPTPPQEQDPPVKPAPDPLHTAAHALATLAFEQTPKPVTPGGFPAVMARCKELLSAGWTADQVAYIIRHGLVHAWSLDSLQLALTRAKERAGASKPGPMQFFEASRLAAGQDR